MSRCVNLRKRPAAASPRFGLSTRSNFVSILFILNLQVVYGDGTWAILCERPDADSPEVRALFFSSPLYFLSLTQIFINVCIIIIIICASVRLIFPYLRRLSSCNAATHTLFSRQVRNSSTLERSSQKRKSRTHGSRTRRSTFSRGATTLGYSLQRQIPAL